MKDVFPNSGRFSVTLDPTIDKRKVVRSRLQKRAQGKKRSSKVKEAVEGVAEGKEMEAQVVKVRLNWVRGSGCVGRKKGS